MTNYPRETITEDLERASYYRALMYKDGAETLLLVMIGVFLLGEPRQQLVAFFVSLLLLVVRVYAHHRINEHKAFHNR